MKVLVTGATGFVGRHVVSALLAKGHSVIAVARDADKARSLPWFAQVEFISCDLHRDFRRALFLRPQPAALIHLAWPGLPNYRDFFHVGRNLPGDLAFLEAAVDAGVLQIMVAGTCLEYGLQHGPLTEQADTAPITAYGFAKDALRKSLQFLQERKPFTLQWMRLFYMYGEGQNPNSLLAQLDRAIDEDAPFFNMSAGDQLRDYLPIHKAAAISCARLTTRHRATASLTAVVGNRYRFSIWFRNVAKRDRAKSNCAGVITPILTTNPWRFGGCLRSLTS